MQRIYYITVLYIDHNIYIYIDHNTAHFYTVVYTTTLHTYQNWGLGALRAVRSRRDVGIYRENGHNYEGWLSE